MSASRGPGGPAVEIPPFYVMEKVEGVILRRDLPPGLSYTPERARQLCLNLVDTLVRLHSLDYAAIGLAEFGHPEGYVGRQVKGYLEEDGIPPDSRT